jgi:hypothetical protein
VNLLSQSGVSIQTSRTQAIPGYLSTPYKTLFLFPQAQIPYFQGNFFADLLLLKRKYNGNPPETKEVEGGLE